jgi:hypothetical protein
VAISVSADYFQMALTDRQTSACVIRNQALSPDCYFYFFAA